MGVESEMVAIVDRENQVVGAVARAVMRAEVMLHRAVFLLLFNGKGELYIQRRAATKDLYPGCHDISAAGVVLAGESYDQAAVRELAEELGVIGVELTRLGDFFSRTAVNQVWGRAYRCSSDGELTLQAEEVAGGDFFTLPEVARLAATAPFTGDGLFLLRALGLVKEQTPPPPDAGSRDESHFYPVRGIGLPPTS